MGRSHIQQQQLQPGIAMLRRALSVQPGQAEVLYELGRALYELGQTQSALECFDVCLASKPGYADTHNARGIMLSNLGRNEDASRSFLQAVTLNPHYASAYNNLGNEYLKLGKHEDALASFNRAIELQPDFANAYNGRGSILLFLDRHEEALDSFERAIALEDDLTEAWNGRAIAFSNLSRYEEALSSYQRVLADQPDNYQALYNIGEMLTRMGRQVEALEYYNQALAISPDFEPALAGKGNALMALGHEDEAIRTFESNVELHPDNPHLLSALLFDLNYLAGIPLGEVFAWHRKFGERFETHLKFSWRPHTNSPDPHRPLRVGFVSGDFRHHPVGIFMEGILANLDSESLHLYAYANQNNDDEVTDRLRLHFDEWRNSRALSDEEMADQIRADGIDILIDLSGHSLGNCLLVFARKPAPVQATYLGYFSSTGLTAMDYFLGDHWQMPGGAQRYYTETPYCLPHRLLCVMPPDQHIPVGPLPAKNNGYVTFGNFNNLGKMNNATISCWAGVLNALPNSRLFLKTKLLESSDIVKSVFERFSRHGVGAERLMVEGSSSYDSYLKSFQCVDIALDPFPYSGGHDIGGGSVDGGPGVNHAGGQPCGPKWSKYHAHDGTEQSVR